MLKKAAKWLFCAALLIATGAAAMHIGTKINNWVQKENNLLAAAGGQAANALRSVGEAGQTFLSKANEKQMTVLLTGVDDAWGGTDVIMLVAMDLENGSVRVVQIPRDTYVQREGSTSHKINAIYAAAAAQARGRGDNEEEAARKGNIALKGFLKENMGISIDHYVSVSTAGLRTIVDAVGGVQVKVPQNIDYDDESQNLHIHLTAGEQLLNGEAAEQFVRFRSGYLTADYGRMDAQKIFLSAFFHKIKSEFSISTALGLLKAGLSNTVSDLTLPDLIPLMKGLLGISESDVKMVTLKGQSAKDENGALCEVLCRSYTIELLSEYLPFQSGIDEAHFDPHRVFTSEGEINELYYGDSVFNIGGITADRAEELKLK